MMPTIKTRCSHQGWRAFVQADSGDYITTWHGSENAARCEALLWWHVWKNLQAEKPVTREELLMRVTRALT